MTMKSFMKEFSTKIYFCELGLDSLTKPVQHGQVEAYSQLQVCGSYKLWALWLCKISCSVNYCFYYLVVFFRSKIIQWTDLHLLFASNQFALGTKTLHYLSSWWYNSCFNLKIMLLKQWGLHQEIYILLLKSGVFGGLGFFCWSLQVEKGCGFYLPCLKVLSPF